MIQVVYMVTAITDPLITMRLHFGAPCSVQQSRLHDWPHSHMCPSTCQSFSLFYDRYIVWLSYKEYCMEAKNLRYHSVMIWPTYSPRCRDEQRWASSLLEVPSLQHVGDRERDRSHTRASSFRSSLGGGQGVLILMSFYYLKKNSTTWLDLVYLLQ